MAVDLDGALQRAIVKVCELDAADVQPETRLDALGVDSLAVAEIIVEVEIELDRELPVHLLRRLDSVQTVGDVAAELAAAVAETETEPRASATIDAAELKAGGTSPAAIARHYDLSDDFFALWLGADLVYSCALWSADDRDTARDRPSSASSITSPASSRSAALACSTSAAVGARCSTASSARHGAAGGVGLTLSPAQVDVAAARAVPGVEYRLEHWADHEPAAPYDAITCIEATEHFASDALDADAKVEVYRAFFERCAAWLRPGGRVGLQLICLDDVGHDGSRGGRGPLSELIRTVIFPESMPASLGELVLGWETQFRLVHFLDHSQHYVRTFRAWSLAERAERAAPVPSSASRWRAPSSSTSPSARRSSGSASRPCTA